MSWRFDNHCQRIRSRSAEWDRSLLLWAELLRALCQDKFVYHQQRESSSQGYASSRKVLNYWLYKKGRTSLARTRLAFSTVEGSCGGLICRSRIRPLCECSDSRPSHPWRSIGHSCSQQEVVSSVPLILSKSDTRDHGMILVSSSFLGSLTYCESSIRLTSMMPYSRIQSEPGASLPCSGRNVRLESE